ncbi:hypothetical protein [Ectothiorhodospira sp. BSL-9]|uniref:hypothetical protein n=1 Tax=Ectothiorhodospira sp. BSL-9 TaxID=1442136 RepID=UPI0007B431DF|nr:hypothetical protein [Ectothiorhodospira sp. BSL-9]ANB02703.1 hypothetical protein ECTOBSL9_2160 [Ectothiorhodospira sp. BSL-9]TVQ72846.1 MAG: hypothetical protein EA372_06535 [Chromatiaceae bacterium]
MYALIKPFLQLTFLQKGPEDLPASAFLLWLCAIVYLFVGLIVAVPFYPFQIAILQAGMELGLLAAFTALLLQGKGVPERFMQTFTALLGVGIVLGLIMLPLVYSLRGAEAPEEIPVVVTVGYLVLLGWLLTAYGHVLRSALGLKTAAGGVALAVAYLMLAAVAGEILYSVVMR